MLYGKALVDMLVMAVLLGGISWGVWAVYDAGGDARETEVRLEWKQEKLDLVATRQAAEREAAELRQKAQEIKQENTNRGENVIEQTRNLSPDWSATRLPAGLYDTLRQN